MSSTVLYEKRGPVATLTLNRPDAMNTMTPELMCATLAALREAASDDELRVLVLTGAGRAFCAGGDVASFARADAPEGSVLGPGSRQSRIDRLRSIVRSSQLLYEMPKITVAAINGACAGAGLSWACACDLRVAMDGARFSVAFRNIGLSGDFGLSWTLPRVVGPAKARELFLLSPRFDAADALHMGLVSKVFSATEFQTGVASMVQELASAPPLALGRAKQNLNDALRMGFSELLDVETARMVDSLGSPENIEAAKAFFTKAKSAGRP
jgi:2-(1,2-epoxy-1,2-dihydrophenyl)acetyl-CoA isomerase